MQRRKNLLIAAAVGAVIGVRLVLNHFGVRISASFPAFAFDPVLLAHRAFLLAACIPWVVQGLYWEYAAKNAAAAKSAEARRSRAFHVFLANFAAVLELAPIRGLGRFLPAIGWIMITAAVAGTLVEVFGVVLAIWARRTLGRNWSGEISIKIEHELIRSGPYRRLRHPIYTGLLAMYAGAALVTGERLALIGFAIAVLAYWRKIRLEERNLEVAFGTDYETYRRESWALVPGVF